jgi:hypothetical protein
LRDAANPSDFACCVSLIQKQAITQQIIWLSSFEEKRMNVQNRLAECRLKRGLTAINLAQEIGVTRQSIKDISGVARKDIKIINRESVAGSRLLLDMHLRQAGISAGIVRGYEETAAGHLQACMAGQKRRSGLLHGDKNCSLRFRAGFYSPAERAVGSGHPQGEPEPSYRANPFEHAGPHFLPPGARRARRLRHQNCWRQARVVGRLSFDTSSL